MKAIPWVLLAVLLGLAAWQADVGADARAESARLRDSVMVAEGARDSVTQWADSVLAARDTAMMRERAKARTVIADAAPAAEEAKAVMANPTASPDTLRLTIRNLLWSNAQVVAAFHAHLAADSAWVAQTNSAWQKKVDVEVKVSDGLRSLNANTARRLTASERRGRRERIVWGLGGIALGWLAKP